MNYIHSGHNFTIIIHLSIIACSLLLGSILRSKIGVLRKNLIPAPMIGGLFLFVFYNYIAKYLNLSGGKLFLEELMFHLLNISFIAMQLRLPVEKNKKVRNSSVKSNLTALIAEYGLQTTFGLLAAILLLKRFLPGSSVALGLSLCLGFELGPGQAGSISKVWEAEPFNVFGASDVGFTMAAIGFVVGSVVGVFFINRAGKKGWLSEAYIEKLRNRKTDNGFFRNVKDRTVSSYLTTASESMDTFTLHLALVLFTYLLSFLFLAGLEKLVQITVGGKVLEAIQGFWGINFVISSLLAVLVRKVLIASKCEHIIDNLTLNRIDGLAVDFTVAACLGAIEVAAIRSYWVVILVLTVIGIIITCFITPYFCSRIFKDYSFMRFLMIFGTGCGTLPTALSLMRVVDPDFETPVAQDYVNATGFMFIFALPILALVNWPAKGLVWQFIGITSAYIIISFVMYIILSGKNAFKKGKLFSFDNNQEA